MGGVSIWGDCWRGSLDWRWVPPPCREKVSGYLSKLPFSPVMSPEIMANSKARDSKTSPCIFKMSQTFKMILHINLSLFIPGFQKGQYYLQFNVMERAFSRDTQILNLFPHPSVPLSLSPSPSQPPSPHIWEVYSAKIHTRLLRLVSFRGRNEIRKLGLHKNFQFLIYMHLYC